MELCPCGSGDAYAGCCEPLIRGERNAETAEALMRSRYSAYAKAEIDYLYQTTHPSQRLKFNHEESAAWSKKSQWISLEVLRTEKGGPGEDVGIVEFVARYREKDRLVNHHEIAEFVHEEGGWRFKDGHSPKPEQAIRKGPKIGRNDPCLCGSGKKHKKCCGR
jgi:SEC-C motif-containing protein